MWLPPLPLSLVVELRGGQVTGRAQVTLSCAGGASSWGLSPRIHSVHLHTPAQPVKEPGRQSGLTTTL